MGMTIIEKILVNHSKFDVVKPGENIDITIKKTGATRDCLYQNNNH